MTFRIRLAILGAAIAGAAVALGGTGLGQTVLARLGSAMVPAQAAVHPAQLDESGRFRSDPGFGAAVGALPVPASMASSSQAVATLLRAATPPASSGGMTVATSAPSSTLRDLNLARAGLTTAPGCSGASCGTDGCGFLAPGCSVLLDCGLLNPACGLGVPVSFCGLLDQSCSRTSCGLFLSGCGGFDEDEGDRFRFDHFRFDHFDHHRFDHHVDSHHRH